jgi:hypothetical protein
MSFGGGGGSSKIATAQDVALSGPTDGQVLSYNGTLAKWQNATNPTAPVSSVAGKTGAVVLAASDVGLGNVDNTSDATKPVSTAQATAIDAKASVAAYSGSAWPTRPSATYVTWIDATGSAPTPSDIQTGDVVIKKS